MENTKLLFNKLQDLVQNWVIGKSTKSVLWKFKILQIQIFVDSEVKKSKYFPFYEMNMCINVNFFKKMFILQQRPNPWVQSQRSDYFPKNCENPVLM